MLLLDVAANYGNYNADLTRTIPVNGRFTVRQRQVYDAVLRIFRECNNILRPGVIIREYQEEVAKIMTSGTHRAPVFWIVMRCRSRTPTSRFTRSTYPPRHQPPTRHRCA